MKVKSCFPEGTNLHQQLDKLLEEVEEVREAAEQGDKENTAKEALDVATVAVGVAEIITEDLASNEEVDKSLTWDSLQMWLDEKMESKKQSYET